MKTSLISDKHKYEQLLYKTTQWTSRNSFLSIVHSLGEYSILLPTYAIKLVQWWWWPSWISDSY